MLPSLRLCFGFSTSFLSFDNEIYYSPPHVSVKAAGTGRRIPHRYPETINGSLSSHGKESDPISLGRSTYGEQLSRLVLQVPVSHPNPGLDSSHSYLSGPADQFHPDRHGTRTLEHPPPRRGMPCPLGSSPGQTGTKLFFSSGGGASSSFPALPCGGAAPLRAACLASRRYYGPLPLCSLFGVSAPGLQHAASSHRPALCQRKDLSL